MDKILQYINNKSNNKFKDLLFFGAEFKKTDKKLNVIFNNHKDIEYSNEDAVLLKNLVKDFVNEDVKISIKFKNIKFDEDICLKEIKKIFTDKKELSLIVAVDEILLNNLNNNYEVVIPCSKKCISPKAENNLNEQMLICFSKFNINDVEFKYVDNEVVNCDEVLEKRLIENSKLVEDNFSPSIQFLEANNIVGKVENLGEILLINKKLTTMKNLTICGTISNIVIKEFTKNNVVKKYASFNLTDNKERVRCVCFTKDAEKLVEIEGKEVAVLADVENNDDLINIKVKSVATGKIVKPKLKMKKVNENYVFVKPEKFIELSQSNFLDNSNLITKEYLLNNSFVVFDLETTGLSKDTDKIIEIGAVKIENGKITEKFATFVNPEMQIPTSATEINKITDEMIKGAPIISDVIQDFYKFCHGSILVAHNISFDFPFIQRDGLESLYEFNHEQLDTYLIAKKFIKGLKNYKLQTVCEHFGVSLIGAHRAVNDTIATAKVFIKLIENFY